ncbi:MAG: MarR family transcriptional regulator [Ktedonobacteraceae bacterium]|nr:MarR family transcriptional regulator [Ktedonobacteraceae bacterium]
MQEHSSFYTVDIVDDLLDIIPSLLQRIRADIPREIDAEQALPEWRDISELRATTGQVRLLRTLVRRQRCAMQELAEQMDVAPPTVTAMIKRLLAQGFVERVRDEQDWRVVWVSPTERGQRAVVLYDQLRRTNLQRRLAHLDAEELTHLRAALPALRHIIEVEP